MMNNDEQQVIALAATVQALTAVHEVATTGTFDEHRAIPLFQGLIHYNPDDTLSAFGGDSNELFHGLTQLERLFGDTLDRDIAQYLLAVVSIELKLVRNPQMRQILNSELQQIAHRLEYNTADDVVQENLTSLETISDFASIYKQTASQTEPRIMIKGNHEHLQNENSANQIRALLLAALRAAAFFRHYGGKRIDFMMKRKQYLEIVKQLK